MLPGRKYTPDDVLRLARRGKWLIVLPFAVGVIGSQFIARRLPDLYRSETLIQLMKQGRREEALSIYRWFRPLLDLDVSTYLVQNIKLAEVFAINTNDRVRMPRQPLSGERRKAVEKIVGDALAVRPKLPTF